MRSTAKNYVKRIAAQNKILEPIYEIGSYQSKGQEELANLRPLFPGKTYVGCDLRPGPGVDLIIDVEKTPLKNDSIGTIIIIDTLEHVKNVHKAMDEIYRILKPGSTVIMASVMKWVIHDHPHDYWRFTPEGFLLLLERFKEKKVETDGEPLFPTGIYGWGIK